MKNTTKKTNSSATIQIFNKSGDLLPSISSMTDITNTGNEHTTGVGINKTGVIISQGQINTGSISQSTKNTTINMLSGTSIYYGQLDIVEKLGIKYQYALTDEQGIWYIYLGIPNYDFASIARALKGSLYTLATEQTILQNKLFGNKVVFINLPEYKDKQVVMLIYLDDGIWLIQMDYQVYHKSKAHLKSLFTD